MFTQSSINHIHSCGMRACGTMLAPKSTAPQFASFPSTLSPPRAQPAHSAQRQHPATAPCLHQARRQLPAPGPGTGAAGTLSPPRAQPARRTQRQRHRQHRHPVSKAHAAN